VFQQNLVDNLKKQSEETVSHWLYEHRTSVQTHADNIFI